MPPICRRRVAKERALEQQKINGENEKKNIAIRESTVDWLARWKSKKKKTDPQWIRARCATTIDGNFSTRQENSPLKHNNKFFSQFDGASETCYVIVGAKMHHNGSALDYDCWNKLAGVRKQQLISRPIID